MKIKLVNLKKSVVTLIALAVTGIVFSQQPTGDILDNISTQTTAMSVILRTIMATIAWIFLGVGIVMIIYSAVVDSSRMKFGIISFLAAALALGVGYGVGLFGA